VTGEQARRRVGRRGAVLLILAAVDIGVGLSYIFPTAETAASQSAQWRDSLAPTEFWGALWIVVGLCCLTAAFFRNDTPGFAPAVGLKVTWSVLELSGWLSGAIAQGYRPALIWAGYALLIFVVAGLSEPTRRGKLREPGGQP
jgi:hypothetical protein